MELKEIANALVAHCKAGTEEEGLATLYDPACRSIEPVDQGNGRVTEGIEGIRGKHAWWAENFTVHGANVEGPFPHGDDKFGVIFDIDAEDKNSGERHKMKEIGVYTVSGGKIVEEAFFY